MFAKLKRHPLLVFAAVVPLIVVSVALLYQGAMAELEGQTRSFWQALGWASETLTTTGYGADARWNHPLMVLLVVCTQILGVLLAYVLVPLLLLPMLESRFAARLPTGTPPLVGHIVIYRSGAAVESLIEDLRDAGHAVVVLEPDEAMARRLLARRDSQPARRAEWWVVHSPGISTALGACYLGRARALIVNGDDEENATALLIAQELQFGGDVIAIAEEPGRQRALTIAGAQKVITPRHVLAEALAARASHRIRPRVDGIHWLAKNLQVAEIRIDADSFLAGKTLEEASLYSRAGITVLGLWIKGRLDAFPKRETRLEPRAILVALGRHEQIDDLVELGTGRRHRREGPVIIAGNGEVGHQVALALREAGETVVVVDIDGGKDGTDIVGDIDDQAVLDQLDLANSRALVLALNSDRATLFAALVVKAAAPDLPIIARVNRADNVERIHRAGADFALSISQVAAQILSHRLLGRETRAVDTEIEIRRTEAGKLVGQSLSSSEIRRRTGCSLVAVERGEDILTELDADFRFAKTDTLYICGHHAATARFIQVFG